MSRTTQVEPTPAPAAQTFQPMRPANPGQPVIEVSDLRVTYRGSTTPLAAILAGSGIVALVAILELRLGERHLLQQSYAA